MSSKHPSRTHTQSAHTRPLLSEVSKVTIIPFSLLWWTNETLNIWSHIAGFVVFFGLFLYDVNVVYYKYQATENDAVVASFVLLCFMVSSVKGCRRFASFLSHFQFSFFSFLSYHTTLIDFFLSFFFLSFWK